MGHQRTNNILGAGSVTPSERSLRRWAQNGTARQAKTGNHPKRKLRGVQGVLLAMYRIANPKATADQMITFIFKCTGRIYSRADISHREIELGFTRKIGSVLAYQALTPANLFKRRIFWTTPFPTGTVGTPRNCKWDVDEAGKHHHPLATHPPARTHADVARASAAVCTPPGTVTGALSGAARPVSAVCPAEPHTKVQPRATHPR